MITKARDKSDSRRNAIIARMSIKGAVIAVLAVVFIIFNHGRINYIASE